MPSTILGNLFLAVIDGNIYTVLWILHTVILSVRKSAYAVLSYFDSSDKYKILDLSEKFSAFHCYDLISYTIKSPNQACSLCIACFHHENVLNLVTFGQRELK